MGARIPDRDRVCGDPGGLRLGLDPIHAPFSHSISRRNRLENRAPRRISRISAIKSLRLTIGFGPTQKLNKLSVSKKLQAAAQAHALDMAEHRKMSHRGSRGSTLTDRIKAKAYRYRRAGENVAAGRFTSNGS